MKQLLQHLRSGETTLAEVPVPTPKAGTVLVRTAASLVSAGTERMVVEFAEKSLVGKARSRPDLVRQVVDKARREGLLSTAEAAFNRLDQPMPLGYSSAGVIVSLGEGVTGFQVGQRVACAGGGYAVHAEYAIVPVNLLARLPDGLGFESAAFATLGAIALHGFRLAEVQVGARVAVIGLGLLGLLSAGLAQAAGCSVLGIDLDPQRVALGRQIGAQCMLRAEAEEAAQTFSLGCGLDAVLICADTPSDDPVILAGAIARDRAPIVAVGAVGLNLPRKTYYQKELNLIVSRSYGPGRYDPAYEEGGQDYPISFVRWTEGRNLQAIVDLMAAGRLDVRPLISHRFPFERAAEAYQLITGKTGQPFLGVLLTYPQKQSMSAPRLEFPATAAAEKEVRLGVLGAGNFATAVMLPAVKKIPAIGLHGVASASGATAAHAARKFGFRFAASNPAEILQDAHINTVAVLTRHHLHARQVLAGLQAGKHVFCEKPLALIPEELAQIEQALAQSNRLLTVGFNRRFAPLAVRMQAFLSSRREPLFAQYRVNAGYIPPEHWLHDPAQGGGRILGEGCHFVDFLAFLVGAPPSKIRIQGLPDQGKYRQDNVLLTCTFPDGSMGTVAYLANGDKSFPKERVEVFSGGRVAVLDDFRRLETVRQGRRQTLHARLKQDKGHRAIWEQFARAIVQGGPPPIPYAQIFGVHRALFKALDRLDD